MSDISDHMILNTMRERKREILIQRGKKKLTTENQTYRGKSQGDV